MRSGFLLALLIAVVFGGGYWYRAYGTMCSFPIKYHIGEIDSRFGTDREELRRVAERAERMWEVETGQNLFEFTEGTGLPIHLVFDERQENADVESELREDLEAKEGMSEEFAAQYDALIGEFRKLRREYESRVGAYEKRLGAHNEEVSAWNDRGGAPSGELERLKSEEEELLREQSALEKLAKELNGLVTQLNAIGARANTLIRDYNTVVERYNERVTETGEFTQGDFTGEAINVYQFNSEDELVLVLAHEFGHALSLGHVPNERSVMYHLMESQSVEHGLTGEDRAAFDAVCAKKGLLLNLLGLAFGR